jgi:hypothetical protein
MTQSPARATGRTVQLMATCLCDAFFDDVAKATVEVLEHAGCEVEFPENQTCCGQPAFNCGDWPASREVMRHTTRVFEGDKPVIVPSGSCAAMLFHGAPLEFENLRRNTQLMGCSLNENLTRKQTSHAHRLPPLIDGLTACRMPLIRTLPCIAPLELKLVRINPQCIACDLLQRDFNTLA